MVAKNILEDLGSFFKDEELKTEELSKEDTATLDEMDAAHKARPELEVYAPCAYISYGERCGFAKAGSVAYVQNRLRNRRVRATVRVTWRQGIQRGTYQLTRVIPAGGRVSLGCTSSSNIPVAYYSFAVIGCETL